MSKFDLQSKNIWVLELKFVVPVQIETVWLALSSVYEALFLGHCRNFQAFLTKDQVVIWAIPSPPPLSVSPEYLPPPLPWA